MGHSLERIVVVPRNGYANRLQAWASAAILGAHLDVPVRVAWEPEAIAPATAEDLFRADAITRSFWTREQTDALTGVPHESLPRYLTVDADRRLVVLAGHDRGEQVFMPDVVRALDDPCKPTTLLIIAGGLFHLEGPEDAVRQREIFYRRLPWRADIDDRVDAAVAGRGAYVGLHVRGTDRSATAPTRRQVRAALSALRDVGPTSLFIAADTVDAVQRWTQVAREEGYTPWAQQDLDHDRTRASAGVDAVVDWRILGQARAIVYSAASSFGEEAAVATGHRPDSIPLTATPRRQQVRAAGALARSAVTYPRRHGWWGRTD